MNNASESLIPLRGEQVSGYFLFCELWETCGFYVSTFDVYEMFQENSLCFEKWKGKTNVGVLVQSSCYHKRMSLEVNIEA